jgi:branched-chain amino acid transport system substrate-binding protein
MFGEANAFVVERVREKLARGLTIGRAEHPVEILVRDCESDPARAGELATELVRDYKVHLMLATGTAEILNAVAVACEADATPCVTALAPWQPCFLGRGGAGEIPPFQWAYHVGWGLEDLTATFADIWRSAGVEKKVGLVLSDDLEGRAWRDESAGFPVVLDREVYQRVDPGLRAPGTTDWSDVLDRTALGSVDVVLALMSPLDFTGFWSQLRERGLSPRAATIGRALLCPPSFDALGDEAENVACEVIWNPELPYRSSLTGETAKQLAEAYAHRTGRHWIQLLGPVHALFEVACAAFTAVAEPDNRKEVRDAIRSLALDTVTGRLDFSGGPVPNVAKTKLAGGQWRLGERHPYELVIVSNVRAPEFPVAGKVQRLPGREATRKRRRAA